MPVTEKDVVAIAHCSFCLRPNTEVKVLVAGPAVFVCNECVDLCSQIISDHPAVNGCPVQEGKPRRLPWEQAESLDVVLGHLPKVAVARTQVEESLSRWVGRARALGATWQQVGDALGMTRQSAWERFAPDD
jgi:ClpX C4-type zinc finger